MLEFYSSTYSVNKWEEFCLNLVKLGLATNYKEPVKDVEIKTQTSGYDLERAYQLFVKPSDYGFGGRVNVRFWYNNRTNGEGFKVDQACWKISQEGLDTLLESMTLVSILTKHGIRLRGKGGKIQLNELTRLANILDQDIETVEKIEPGKLVIKTKEK